MSGARPLVPCPQLIPLPSSPPCCTMPPPAQGLLCGAGFPCVCAGQGSPANACPGFGTCYAGTCNCLCTVAHVQAPATSAPLPTLQDSSDVPSFLSQGQGRGRPSSQQGPSSSCLLDSPRSHGLQAPGSSMISFFPVSIFRFPLASSSTCKQALASASISKHPPFPLLLPASPPGPPS